MKSLTLPCNNVFSTCRVVYILYIYNQHYLQVLHCCYKTPCQFTGPLHLISVLSSLYLPLSPVKKLQTVKNTTDRIIHGEPRVDNPLHLSALTTCSSQTGNLFSLICVCDWFQPRILVLSHADVHCCLLVSSDIRYFYKLRTS